MLPPRYTVFSAARSISAMMLVVVVLPSLPVTPMIVHGQTSKKISISDVTMRRALRPEQRWNVRPHARRAENDVRAQIIEVAFAKLQVRAQRFKLLRALAEVFAALLSQAMTCTPFRHKSSMSGVLLTPCRALPAFSPQGG